MVELIWILFTGGEKIKQINAQCGAYCEIDRKLSSVNPAEKVFVIRGTPEQIEEAKRLIIEYSGIVSKGFTLISVFSEQLFSSKIV